MEFGLLELVIKTAIVACILLNVFPKMVMHVPGEVGMHCLVVDELSFDIFIPVNYTFKFSFAICPFLPSNYPNFLGYAYKENHFVQLQ